MSHDNFLLNQTIDTLKSNLVIQEQFETLLLEKEATINQYKTEFECLKNTFTQAKEMHTTKEEEFINKTVQLTEEIEKLQKSNDTLDNERISTVFDNY